MSKFQKGNPGGPGRKPGAKLLGPAIRKYFTGNPAAMERYMKAVIQNAEEGNAKCVEVVRAALDGPEIKQFNITELTNEQILELLAQGDEDGLADGDEADSEPAG